MKKINDWGLFAKLMSLVTISLIPVLLLVFIYLMPTVSNKFVEEKQVSNKQLVEVAVSHIETYIKLAKQGLLSVEEAQKKALSEIKNFRYDKTNYFWINDYDAKMIMHPMKPELDGKILWDEKDPNGVFLFREFAKTAKEQGSGFVNYVWEKPGHKEPQSKISYVHDIKDWGWVVGSGMYIDDIEDEINALYFKSITGVLFALLTALLLGYFFAKYLIKPIKKLQEAAANVAIGNVDIDIKAESLDEFGNLLNAFSEMVKSIKEKSIVADKLSMGDLNAEVTIYSEKDVLSKSINKLATILKNLNKDITLLTNAAANGDLNKRGDASKYSGGFSEIIAGINSTLDAVILPVKDGTAVLERMAKGDLTVRVIKEFEGDHKIIKNGINQLGDSLENVIHEVSRAVEATSSSSAEISSSAEQMASGTESYLHKLQKLHQQLKRWQGQFRRQQKI